MQAFELISSTIQPILPDEDGERALELMNIFRVNHLAIVKNNFYLGAVRCDLFSRHKTFRAFLKFLDLCCSTRWRSPYLFSAGSAFYC